MPQLYERRAPNSGGASETTAQPGGAPAPGETSPAHTGAPGHEGSHAASGGAESAATPTSWLRDAFRRIASVSADAVGSPAAFFVALATVIVWAFAGPRYQYSDTWQLVINTGTTIVTFLMVFLIQNAQNRDARAIHLKLDELIRGVHGARNTMIELQDLTDDQLDELQAEFQRLRESGRLRRSARSGAPSAEPANADARGTGDAEHGGP